MAAAGGQDVQAELQEYLNKKGINSLFIKIVEDLLLNMVQQISEAEGTGSGGDGLVENGRVSHV